MPPPIPQNVGRWAGGRAPGAFLAPLYLPMQVLEILKLREEEEEAHVLTISIYDTKRNGKSKEYREAMVSLAPCLGITSPWSVPGALPGIPLPRG